MSADTSGEARPPRVAVAGGFGGALTIRVADYPQSGETIHASSAFESLGGKGSNQAVAAARLGAAVGLLSAIGDDEVGRSGIAMWRAEGVDWTNVVRLPGPSMFGVIILEQDGDNRIVIVDGALQSLTPVHTESFRDSVEQADVLLVSGEVPEDVVEACLLLGRRSNVLTILNPAPITDRSQALVRLADVITPNEVEARALLEDRSDRTPGEIAVALAERFGVVAVVTLGSNGVVFARPGEPGRRIEAFPVQDVVDTTGAGDTFSAALAVQMAEGIPLRESLLFASAAAALSVGVAGVIPALPNRAAVVKFRQNFEDPSERKGSV